MKRWFRWAAVCLLALALLAACALAETREDKYTQDGWDYCDSYDEDDTLVQRTRTQALEDGTRCEERYDLVAGELTLVRENILDADGNRLSGSFNYLYDYETGEYQGCVEYLGIDAEGRKGWREYDSGNALICISREWQDENGIAYWAQYDEVDQLYERHAREWLENGGCIETSEELVADELKVVSKDIYDADGNKQPGSINYLYDYDTGDYQGYGEYLGADEEGHNGWKEYDENNEFICISRGWEDENGIAYWAQYDADGKLYARQAREWLENGGCNETSEALVAGELKVVSKDIYDADGNRQPGSIDYHYDDETGAYQGRTEYQGVDANGYENWKTYDKDNVYQYRYEAWETDQNHRYENCYDASEILVKKYVTTVQSNGTSRVQYSQRINGSLRLMSDIYWDDDDNLQSGSVNYIRDDQTGECLLKMTYAGRNEQGRDTWEMRTTDNYYVGKTLNWEDRRGLHQEIVDEKGKVIARYLNGVELKGKPKSVVLSPSGKQQLMLGEKLQLDYSFKPANAYSEIKWSSSNKAVATVSQDGLVTALADGNAVITAKASNGGVKATVTITVIDPAKPTGITLEAGKTARLALQDTLKLNYTLLPEGTAESDVKFTTSDKRIATVSADGVVTPLKEGKVTITATTAKNSRAKATITITVFDPKKPTGITLEAGKTARLALQDTLQLNYTLLPETAESDVKFTTSDKRIATVSADGVVTPLKEGKVTITAATAKNSRIKATITITVFDPKKPTGITLEAGKTARLALQDTLKLNYTLLPETAESDVKFTTSDKRIATVSAEGVVTPLKEGKVTITAKTAKNGRKAAITITIFDPKKPTGITLEAGKTARLALQDTLKLNYTLLPETAESDVKFTTSDKRIATVSAEGVVTPLKEGKVTITAKTAKNNRKATITITVFDPKKPTGITLEAGKTARLALQDTLQLNYTLLPETAESDVKFTTSDKRIATVSADGVVTPLKEGKVTITAKTAKNGRIKATIAITVFDPKKPTGITLEAGKTARLALQDTLQLNYTLLPETAESEVKFTTSDKRIATVSADGVVTPLKEGKVTITATTAKNGRKAAITITVFDPKKPTGVQFVQSGTVKVNLGETLQLEYGLLPETAESDVKFTTSDKRIATVSADGVVTPLKEGKAKITVTTTKNKNAKATITVQVVDPTKATGVAFVDAERTVTVGENFTLEYRLEPVTATTKATLSSSNSAIVKVNADGTLSALKEGKATITVKTANKLSAKVVVTVVPAPVIEPEEPQLPTEGEDVPPTDPEQKSDADEQPKADENPGEQPKDEEQPKADENPGEQPKDEEQPKADENPEGQPKDEEQPKADENPEEQPKDEEQPKAEEDAVEQPKAEEQPAEEKSEQAE